MRISYWSSDVCSSDLHIDGKITLLLDGRAMLGAGSTAFLAQQVDHRGSSHLVEQCDGGGPTGCDVHAGRARDLLEMVMPTAGGATREHSAVNGHGDKARQQCHLVVAGHGADCVEPAFGGDRCAAGRHHFLHGANVPRCRKPVGPIGTDRRSEERRGGKEWYTTVKY